MTVLHFAARYGRWVLLGGLLTSLALPGLARSLAPLILPLLGALLFLAALRVGEAGARLPRAQVPRVLGLVLLLQLAVPLGAVAVFLGFGVMETTAALAVVLVLAASPITGAPGLAILSGADPAPALRLTVLGTAMMPLTALPVLLLLPVFADLWQALEAVLRLLALVLLTGGAAFWLRRRFPALGTSGAAGAIDGAVAVLMGVLVVALTSALGPALRAGDPALWGFLALALALNFGAQIATHALLRRCGYGVRAPSLAIVAGNRNLALFLPALPTDASGALLLFVGCYQVPMFLTPLLLAPLYRRAVDSPPAGLGARGDVS